ncbi:hypothetical protein Xen7305DRAFT_00000620 [Xenococcus sp. PCC 7305]|uniref:hypothetical protein n=1 Tax=Xenococcus sp. PCC 7305 TaxID=102125 RepID=UPI0002ABC1F7|nr:hypothetical protein [Xenococcus sp. PCC 7305]ELS00362.1 hypothetical protein Xen7305DRAFT_00000620 [Xenococcus sp. PCC 7305]
MNAKIKLPDRAAAIPEIEVPIQRNSESDIQPLSTVSDSGHALIGSQPGDVTVKVSGFNIVEIPSVVICQARQSTNFDRGYTDQFAIQVIETATTFIRFRVRRIDDGTGSSGWGQNLRVDILVIN